jgi:hypothetical protein
MLSSRFIHIVVCVRISFLFKTEEHLLNVYSTFCLPIYWWTTVVSTSWLLCIVLLWTWGCKLWGFALSEMWIVEDMPTPNWAREERKGKVIVKVSLHYSITLVLMARTDTSTHSSPLFCYVRGKYDWTHWEIQHF